jgi:hypothetical protein
LLTAAWTVCARQNAPRSVITLPSEFAFAAAPAIGIDNKAMAESAITMEDRIDRSPGLALV